MVSEIIRVANQLDQRWKTVVVNQHSPDERDGLAIVTAALANVAIQEDPRAAADVANCSSNEQPPVVGDRPVSDREVSGSQGLELPDGAPAHIEVPPNGLTSEFGVLGHEPSSADCHQLRTS
jgi:hypothetical protein